MRSLRSFIIILLSCSLLFSFSACSSNPSAEQKEAVYVTATTYPIYVLACAVSSGVDHVTVGRLHTGQVSCLHDYTLTVSDMRQLERADLLLLNGAGLEHFMDHVLEQLSALQVDCSASIDLLEAEEHEHHSHSGTDDDGHEHEHDPHYWMAPSNLTQMADSIAQALSSVDPDHGDVYKSNAALISQQVSSAYTLWQNELSGLSCPYLITFHDGFRYFADAFELTLLFSMEEEDGATASAHDICSAAELVKSFRLPAIFTEENGSGAAARAVSGETGVRIASLSMVMDGDDIPAGTSVSHCLDALLIPMQANIDTLAEVLK